MATMLQAVELPPIGGDTLFANQHLAWDRLSDGLQQTLAGLRLICTAGKAKVAASRTARIAEKGKAVDADAMQASHPVVRTHPETGKSVLYRVLISNWAERAELEMSRIRNEPNFSAIIHARPFSYRPWTSTTSSPAWGGPGGREPPRLNFVLLLYVCVVKIRTANDDGRWSVCKES